MLLRSAWNQIIEIGRQNEWLMCNRRLNNEKADKNKIDEIEKLLITCTIQLDAVAMLLMEKGIFSKEEYSEMVEKVMREYQKDDR